jgi:hypothetical protein
MIQTLTKKFVHKINEERIFPRRRSNGEPARTADIPNKKDQVELKKSILRLRDVKAMLDELEKEKASLSAVIGDILDASGIVEIRHFDARILRITASRTTLKRELLLEQGVDPKTIARAEITTEYKYVKLDIDKEK